MERVAAGFGDDNYLCAPPFPYSAGAFTPIVLNCAMSSREGTWSDMRAFTISSFEMPSMV